MRKLSLVVMCALVLGACVNPPEDIDRVPDFDPEETRMGQIQERGELLVGIPDAPLPPFSLINASAFEFQGFLLDLSQEIAHALGVEVEPVFLEEDELILPGRAELELPGALEESPVDISFPQLPATEELAKEHPLTHPYWVAHQRLLVRSDPSVDSVDDLPGRTGLVCSVLDDTTGIAPTDLNETLKEVPSDIEGCARMLRREDVDAVTAPDLVLMSVWAEATDCIQVCAPSADYDIVGDELTTAGYSAMLPLGAPGWTNFVNATWAETDFEGRWMGFYEEWIAPYGIDVAAPPEMRIEEAAGLFPCSGC